MRKVNFLSIILAISILPTMLRATSFQMPAHLKKQLLLFKKMQPLLHQSYKDNSMNKTNKVLSEYYRMTSPNGKNSYTDSTYKTLVQWDSKGNPTRYETYDFTGGYTSRSISTQFVKWSNPSPNTGGGPYFSFNWLPLVTINQNQAGAKWLTQSIDSVLFDSKNQVMFINETDYDSASTHITKRQKTYMVTNSHGDPIGFRIDTLAGISGWKGSSGSKFDTLYNASHKINGIILSTYDPASAGWTKYVIQNYFLDANAQPINATVKFVVDSGIIDSYANISWQYYYNSPPKTLIDLLSGNSQNELLFTGGAFVKYFDDYRINSNTLTLEYSNTDSISYNADSTQNVNIYTRFDGFNLTLSKDAYTYYPDRILQADTSETWTGKWQIDHTTINQNTYDADGYLSTLLNRSQNTASGTYFNYKDTYLYSAAAGIDEAVSITSDLRIYPNPANNVLFIEISTPETKASTIRVLNMNGQLISETHYTATNEIQCDVSKLKSGMYLIQYSNDKDFAVKTFVKQ